METTSTQRHVGLPPLPGCHFTFHKKSEVLSQNTLSIISEKYKQDTDDYKCGDAFPPCEMFDRRRRLFIGCRMKGQVKIRNCIVRLLSRSLQTINNGDCK